MENELDVDIFIPYSKKPEVNKKFENIYFFTKEGNFGEMDYFCFDAQKKSFVRVGSILKFIIDNEINTLRKIPEKSEKVFLSLTYRILESTGSEDYDRYKEFMLVRERRKR